MKFKKRDGRAITSKLQEHAKNGDVIETHFGYDFIAYFVTCTETNERFTYCISFDKHADSYIHKMDSNGKITEENLL